MEKQTETEEISIEQAFEQLDKMMEQLESRDISLEDSFQVYKQGMDLLKYCHGKIDMVEKKMLQVNEDGELSEL